PGKLLSTVDPGAVDRLAARLDRGSVLVSATNGKTTTTAMVAEIVGGRLAYNRSGANLLSGVASTLLSTPHAELGLFEVDEAALPEVTRRVRPRVLALGNLFRDQLDRYGELEHVAARWRRTVADLPDALLVVNADDPLLSELARGRERRVTYGLDDPRHARSSLQHAADSTYCLVCGAPFEYAAAYVGHLGDFRCPNGHTERLPLAVAARAGEVHGPGATACALEASAGSVRVELSLPGLYNVYNATAAAAIAGAVGAPLEAVAGGLRRFTAAFGRFERIDAGDRRVLMLLIKNPAGANEAVRTLLGGEPPRLAVVGLDGGLARGRGVSRGWALDFQPLLAGLGRGGW